MLLSLPALVVAQQKIVPLTPDKIYGQLFKDVQLQKVLPDGKTFVDCTPKKKVADIMYNYGMMKNSGIDLKTFIADNFNLMCTNVLPRIAPLEKASLP